MPLGVLFGAYKGLGKLGEGCKSCGRGCDKSCMDPVRGRVIGFGFGLGLGQPNPNPIPIPNPNPDPNPIPNPNPNQACLGACAPMCQPCFTACGCPDVSKNGLPRCEVGC